MTRAAAALAALLALVGPAAAQGTGAALLEICNGRDRAEVMSCGLYILGIVQGHQLAAPAGRALCLPEDADGFRLRDTVLAALRRNPDAGKEAAAPLVIGALRAAFPCRP